MAAIVRPRKTSSDARRGLVLDEVVTGVLADGERNSRRCGPGKHFVAPGEAVKKPRRDVHLRLVAMQGGSFQHDLRRCERDVDPSRDAAVEIGREWKHRARMIERP